MFVGELAMTPRIWLVAVCCSSDSLSSWTRCTFSLAVASSRCNDSASCRRNSPFVCPCPATDVFTTARRGFTLVFLEPFLVVVATKHRVGRPSQTKLKRWPDQFNCGNGSPVFYARRLVASRKDCVAHSVEKTAHRRSTLCACFCLS